LGHGGAKRVWNATGVARGSILAGLKELEQVRQEQQKPTNEQRRIRRPGAGRKTLLEQDPTIRIALERLVEPMTVGDPETPLRWTCKSLMHLSRELQAQGYTISHVSVGALLKEMGYGLQGNRKTLEGKGHPDRNAQFEFINQKADAALLAGQPVISVDTKKKELVGQFKNGGKEWRPEGDPEKVNVYDFVDKELGRANPYGVYDLANNTAWVSVGTDHDTASFAVSTIQRWWHSMGKSTYPEAKELMIMADGGGSNGSRVRLWKLELQRFACSALLCVAFHQGVRRRPSRIYNFAAQWLACRCLLSTLRYTPRDGQRMTRGQDGSLLLSCIGLSPTITCQFVLAHSPNIYKKDRKPMWVAVFGYFINTFRQRLACGKRGFDLLHPRWAEGQGTWQKLTVVCPLFCPHPMGVGRCMVRSVGGTAS